MSAQFKGIPLGAGQRETLEKLCETGRWSPGAWTVIRPGETRRMLDALVRRGLAQRIIGGDYAPTDAGREEVASWQ